jgi:hypothetical protein
MLMMKIYVSAFVFRHVPMYPFSQVSFLFTHVFISALPEPLNIGYDTGFAF